MVQELKADRQLRPIPVIMLTMSDRDEDIALSYACGACSYIRKPVDLDQFNAFVRQFEVYWTMVSKIPAQNSSLNQWETL